VEVEVAVVVAAELEVSSTNKISPSHREKNTKLSARAATEDAEEAEVAGVATRGKTQNSTPLQRLVEDMEAETAPGVVDRREAMADRVAAVTRLHAVAIAQVAKALQDKVTMAAMV